MGFRCLYTDTWISLLCPSVCSVKYVCACVCLWSPGKNLGGKFESLAVLVLNEQATIGILPASPSTLG